MDELTQAPLTQQTKKEESGFYEAYAGFARTLRTWFVAYGIGGPVIFLTNDTAAKRFQVSGSSRAVAYSFFAGVALQILAALLYKTAMWYLYRGELEPGLRSARLYKISDRFSECYWAELLVDFATLVFFGVATLNVLNAFLS